MSLATSHLDSPLFVPARPLGRSRLHDAVWIAVPLALFAYLWTVTPWAQPTMAHQQVHMTWQPLLVLCSMLSLLTLTQAWVSRLPGRIARSRTTEGGILLSGVLLMVVTQLWCVLTRPSDLLFTSAGWLFVQWMALLLVLACLKTRQHASAITTAHVTDLHPTWRDYLALTKMGLNGLVLFTTFVGFYMATPESINWLYCLTTLLGTGLVAWGASALNQFMERDVDALMRRTKVRPLPACRMAPHQAMTFGVLLCLAGLTLLALAINVLTAAVAAATLAVYISLYTPLKRINSLSTLAGAISGALPPVIGWVATGRGFQTPALVLFAILFLWQIPHFLAIAWKYREQYAAAGFEMYSKHDVSGRATAVLSMLYCLALVPISILTVAYGISGPLYMVTGALISFGLLGCAIIFLVRPSAMNATRLFLATILYLPFILGIMMVDNMLVLRFHF